MVCWLPHQGTEDFLLTLLGGSEHGFDHADDHNAFGDDQTYFRQDNPPVPPQSPPTVSTESISGGLEPEGFDCADIDLIIPGTYIDTEATDGAPVTDQADPSLISAATMFHCSKSMEETNSLLPRPHVGPKLRVYSRSVLSEHLECVQKVLRLRRAHGSDLRSASHPLNFTTLEEIEALMVCSMPPLVESLMHAFLAHGWPSMVYWFYATRSIPLGCRVLWWETSHTKEAATQVPTGNIPTLIQLSRPPYPCILDWVPHPGLRDLLILNYESYDVDQVVCDMTNAFVVEVEEAGPFANESHLGVPLINAPSTGSSFNLMELVQRTLVSGPIQRGNLQELMAFRLLQSTASFDYASVEHPIHRFKLDPSFFDKYPALHDANAVSKYRARHFAFTQKCQLPLPYNTDTAKKYMDTAMPANYFA